MPINNITSDNLTIDLWASDLLENNPLLVNKIIENMTCECKSSVMQGVTETLRFLYLCNLAAPKSLTPSKRVDDIWHQFILFTRSYMVFCDKSFGQFIHHQPSLTPTIEAQQYNHTLDLYRQYFGHPNKEYWGCSDDHLPKGHLPKHPIASCGACEN